MEVLKKGRKQKGWSKEFDCTGAGNDGGGCGARLLVSEDDIVCTGWSHCRDESTQYFGFICPDCGVKTDVKNNDIPHRIIEKINRVSNNTSDER